MADLKPVFASAAMRVAEAPDSNNNNVTLWRLRRPQGVAQGAPPTQLETRAALSPEPLVACQTCGCTLHGLAAMDQHVADVHWPPASAAPAAAAGVLWTCGVCSTTFGSVLEVVKHSRSAHQPDHVAARPDTPAVAFDCEAERVLPPTTPPPLAAAAVTRPARFWHAIEGASSEDDGSSSEDDDSSFICDVSRKFHNLADMVKHLNLHDTGRES